MLEAKIYKDNQEPPKNVIWHKVSDAGQDLGYYKNTNNKWNKVDIGKVGGDGDSDSKNNDDIEYYKMNNTQDNINYLWFTAYIKLSNIIINNNLITEIVYHSSDTRHYSPVSAIYNIGVNNINNFAFSINKNIDVVYSIDGKCTILQYGNLYEKIYYWFKNNVGEDEVENENRNIDEAINTLKQVFIPISKEEYYSLATNV